MVMFLPVKYSYLSILPDDKADISAAFLLISYCIFLRIFLNLKGSSVASVQKNCIV